MIAVNIGRTFLDAYNEKFQKSYSAKDFFVEVYFEVFFNHEKYMQWVPNSPFVQGIKKGIPPEQEERQVKLENLVKKVSAGERDASVAIGFPSLDVTASTSGQITGMSLPMDEEEVYLSWIGGGLGIGVQGGLSLFFDNSKILLDLFEGWRWYREWLNQTPQSKGNQINTWNGQWIAHRYNRRTYDEHRPMASFNRNSFASTAGGSMEVTTLSWTEVLLGIAYSFPDTVEVAYVYSLGQTNTTIGFIPFELPKIREPYELYEKYFGKENTEVVKTLFGTGIGLRKACQMGAVGVAALEPKGFRDCFEKGDIPKYGGEKNKEKSINFNAYQIWLFAMLNNEQLWEQAQQIAKILSDYTRKDDKDKEKAKTTKSREMEAVIKAVNKQQFIDKLTGLVNQGQNMEQLDQIAETIHKMPVDNVPYFLTLIRFKYAVENHK
jgi:hypothetical protein